MDGGVVQNVLAPRDAQKARALLEGLLPELWHREQLPPGVKPAVFLPVGNNVFGKRPADPGDVAQKGMRGGVEVHPHAVDAVLNHPVQALGELALRHVVLILPHPDGLGVDLDQLGQRCLLYTSRCV